MWVPGSGLVYHEEMKVPTATITLGGTPYTLQPFTIEQLEKVTELMEDVSANATKRSFALIPLVLACTVPAVPDPKALRATVDEIAIAIRTAMQLSGLTGGEAPASPQMPAAGS